MKKVKRPSEAECTLYLVDHSPSRLSVGNSLGWKAAGHLGIVPYECLPAFFESLVNIGAISLVVVHDKQFYVFPGARPVFFTIAHSCNQIFRCIREAFERGTPFRFKAHPDHLLLSVRKKVVLTQWKSGLF